MKKTTRNGFIILFVLVLVAIVIGGQTFSTIGIVTNDNSNEITCSIAQDCIDDFNENNIPTDVLNAVNVYCNRGICEVEPK